MTDLLLIVGTLGVIASIGVAVTAAVIWCLNKWGDNDD